jgi:hypothetical protein
MSSENRSSKIDPRHEPLPMSRTAKVVIAVLALIALIVISNGLAGLIFGLFCTVLGLFFLLL